jgi:tetratricopeptide (TPR) repeat protein
LLGSIGDVQCEQGEFDEAIDAFKEALLLDQQDHDHLGVVAMHRRLGMAYQEKGDAERANDAYREAGQLLGRLDPHEGASERVMLLIAQASFDLERGGLAAAHDKLEDALQASQSAADVPQQIACLRRLASVAAERGDVAAAHGSLDRAQELLDAQPEEERDIPEQIQVMLLRGAVFEEEGSAQLALDRYREALRRAEGLRLAPARAEALRRMGSAHRARGEFPQAIDRYEQAIAICREIDDEAALSQLHGDIGDVLAEQGSLDDAIRHFRNALDLDQRHQDRLGIAVTQRRLGAAYQEKGEVSRAQDAYAEAARLLEDSDDEIEKALLQTCVGSLDAARGRYKAALEAHEKALEIYQRQESGLGQAICLRHTGAARHQLGHLVDAERDLREALDLLREHGGEDKPEIIEATNLLGAVLEDRGLASDALALYREALRLAESLNHRPARAESLRRMGSVYAVQGDFSAATERYLQAIEIAKQIQDDVALSQLLGDLGDVYLEEGESDEAIDSFKEALRLDSIHSDELGMAVGYRRLGSAHHQRGDYPRARDCYEDAKRLLDRLDDAGERAILSVGWGRMFDDQGQYRTALDHYRHALAINEDQSNDVGIAICLRHIGSAQLRLGDVAEAEEQLERAQTLLEGQGSYGKPELIAVKTAIAEVRIEQRRLAEARELAIDSYRSAEAIQHRPAIAACLRLRGAVDTEEGNFDGAIDRLNEALELAKDLGDEVLRAELLDDLGDAYERKGSLEEALKAYADGLKRARRLDRHALSADILLGLARCQRELGRHDVAREHLEEAGEAVEHHDAGAQVRAMLVMERAQLAEAAGREEFAIEEYQRAAELLAATGDMAAISICRKLLLSAYARRGDLPRAAVQLTGMLAEDSPGLFWTVTGLPQLESEIAASAMEALRKDHYVEAIGDAFTVVQERLDALSDGAGGTTPLSDFARAALDAHREWRPAGGPADAADAFAWISVAHLIASALAQPRNDDAGATDPEADPDVSGAVQPA